MKRPLRFVLSCLLSFGILLGGAPGRIWAQAVVAPRGVPLAPSGLPGAAGMARGPVMSLHAPSFGLAAPASKGPLPSIAVPQAQSPAPPRAASAASAPRAAVAAAGAASADAAPRAAALPASAPRADGSPALAAAGSPSRVSPAPSRGQALRPGAAAFGKGPSKGAFSVRLSRLFDGQRLRGSDEGLAPVRLNAAAPERGRLARPADDRPAQAGASLPAPLPAASSWKRRAVYGVLGLSLAGAAVAFGPAAMRFAENFGSGMDLGSGLTLGTFAIAFAGGLLSFLSPCTLPLIPAYLSFVSGASLDELKSGREASWRRSALGALAFVAGFSTVFTLLGATATAMGALLVEHMPVIAKGAGLVVAVMGLHTMGVLQIGLLYRQKRADMGSVKSRSPLLKAFLMGLAFAFGWSPCIGPILAGILGMAAMGETVLQGTALLAAYSTGLGVPFVLAALAINPFLKFFAKYKKYFGVAEYVTGGLLVLVGLLIFFGGIQQVAGLLGLA